MDDDRQLLRQFTQHNSQTAFAALTARYLSLVYSTCRRELGDNDLAEDVTQAVFLILARKAPSLRREVVLSGWLFQTARFAAKNARLQETRRKAYEQKAADTVREQQMETQDAAWNDIEPLLNQSLAGLRDTERECVLLRFFQGLSFAEAGTALGLSEDAARKRVTRSLEKMRQFFVKNGVIVPAAALSVLLTAHAAKAAPAGLVAGHISAGLTSSHAYQLSEGVTKAMKIAQVKFVAGITTSAVIGLGFYAASRAVTGTAPHPAALLLDVPIPGHVLQQVPGGTLTAGQIAEHCRQAYAALQSYQCTANVTQTFTSPATTPATNTYKSAATIQYEKPGKIHAEGTDDSAGAWAYTSNGTATEQMNLGKGWQNVAATEVGGIMIDTPIHRAISGGVVFSHSAGTTIPMVLLWSIERSPDQNASLFAGMMPGALLREGGGAEVREDMAEGQLCYVLTDHLTLPKLTQTESVWIDKKTFLIHRVVTDQANPAYTGPIIPIPVAEGRTHSEQRITNERLNQPIPDSAFVLPVVQ